MSPATASRVAFSSAICCWNCCAAWAASRRMRAISDLAWRCSAQGTQPGPGLAFAGSCSVPSVGGCPAGSPPGLPSAEAAGCPAGTPPGCPVPAPLSGRVGVWPSAPGAPLEPSAAPLGAATPSATGEPSLLLSRARYAPLLTAIGCGQLATRPLGGSAPTRLHRVGTGLLHCWRLYSFWGRLCNGGAAVHAVRRGRRWWIELHRHLLRLLHDRIGRGTRLRLHRRIEPELKLGERFLVRFAVVLVELLHLRRLRVERRVLHHQLVLNEVNRMVVGIVHVGHRLARIHRGVLLVRPAHIRPDRVLKLLQPERLEHLLALLGVHDVDYLRVHGVE